MLGPRRVVNIAQAQAILGVSRRTVYYWVASGKLTPAQVPSGRLRFDADDLLLVGRTRTGSPPAEVDSPRRVP